VAGPQAVWVEGPPAEPRPYGLFTAAQVVEDAEPRWLMGGARHEVDYCGEAYDSAGACWDFGTLTVTVAIDGTATIDADGYPDGDFNITWGDEGVGEGPETVTVLDGTTHDYTPGDLPLTITITGPRSYGATVDVDVDDADLLTFTGVVGIAKQPHVGVAVVEGEPFAVLHLLECTPVGFGEGTVPLADRAREALRMGEQRAVERVVARSLARDDRAVVLASGTALGPVDALAALEKYAAANYPGRATIHATPDLVTLWDSRGVVTLRTVNGVEQIVTGQGTKVVSGGGYSPMREPTPDPDDVLPANAANSEWGYVTGAVQVRRAGIIEAQSVVNSTGGTAARNQSSYLAERPYVATWDCIVAAVKVTTLDVVPA
jgi:hypothetical protein